MSAFWETLQTPSNFGGGDELNLHWWVRELHLGLGAGACTQLLLLELNLALLHGLGLLVKQCPIVDAGRLHIVEVEAVCCLLVPLFVQEVLPQLHEDDVYAPGLLPGGHGSMVHATIEKKRKPTFTRRSTKTSQ
eukprot:3530149-Amphidinium_carterae.1